MPASLDPIAHRLTIREIHEDDREWVESVLVEMWSSPEIVSRGRMHNALDARGFIALLDEERAGLATYRVEDAECELVTLNALVARRGIGSALVARVSHVARVSGCTRLWLVTTNDNVAAQRFYERNGFGLVAVHRGAVEISRILKPTIPLVGLNGVRMRDEIEYEIVFQ